MISQDNSSLAHVLPNGRCRPSPQGSWWLTLASSRVWKGAMRGTVWEIVDIRGCFSLKNGSFRVLPARITWAVWDVLRVIPTDSMSGQCDNDSHLSFQFHLCIVILHFQLQYLIWEEGSSNCNLQKLRWKCKKYVILGRHLPPNSNPTHKRLSNTIKTGYGDFLLLGVLTCRDILHICTILDCHRLTLHQEEESFNDLKTWKLLSLHKTPVLSSRDRCPPVFTPALGR